MHRTNWHYWTEFLRSVYDAVESLNSPKTIWYRGVTSSGHTLLPSLYRRKNGLEKESALFDKYMQISAGSSLLAPKSDWDVLFEMQHYGVPTRLLDWTEVFGIAIFFAALSVKRNDAHIFILDPERLNLKSGKGELIGDWDRSSFSYKSVFWDGDPFKPSFPIALNPSHSNERLAAQRGRFTVHGVNTDPLEKMAGDCVKKVKLKADAIPAALQYLESAGITEYSIFPDPQGAAPYLQRIVGLQ